MAKGRSRQVARWSNTQSLGHTATTRPDSVRPSRLTVRPTLMRTVLGDTTPRGVAPNKALRMVPRPSLVRSPTVAVRASGRSSQTRVQSPFRNAVLETPQLTQRAMVCARRHIRKEVLFALKRTAKGSSGARRPRSKVRC